MASTITPLTAWTYGFRLIRKMMPATDETALQARILDNAAKWFWMEAPWRWTTGALSNITLASNTQDYTYSGGLPSDFLYVQYAYISDGETTQALKVTSALPSTSVTVGRPNLVCQITSGGDFRVWPKPGTLDSSKTQALVQVYKKEQTPITSLNVNTGGTLVFDDEWFPVYQEIVNWYMYQYAYDNRAGVAQVDNEGKIVYTGQLGLIKSMVAEMRARDPLTPEMDIRTGEPPRKRA